MSGDFTEAAGALSRFAWALQHHASATGGDRWPAQELQLQSLPTLQVLIELKEHYLVMVSELEMFA